MSESEAQVLEGCGRLPEWNRLVLAALLKLTQAAANPPADNMIVNLAHSRRLLFHEDSLVTHRDLLAELRDNPELVSLAMARLEQHLGSLDPVIRGPLARRIYEAAVVLASSSPAAEKGFPFIEPAEHGLLGEFRSLFGLPPGGTRDPLEASGADANPLGWAAAWTEPVADGAFSLLAAMHEIHESEWRAGEGKLNGVKSMDDLPANMVDPVCDQGVLVFPGNWADRRFWIVGDLHGDLRSLDKAMSMIGINRNGFGTEDVVVFLGDYGDRGHGTLAVWLRLAALKQKFPRQVFLLRGNHEETVAVRLTRTDTGKTLNTVWQIPSTSNMESYLMLAMAMNGNLENVGMLFNQIPDVALLPGGVMAIHGSLPPRWKKGDGWRGSDDEKCALTIESLSDLRKAAARGTMRWTDCTDRDEITDGWSDYGRGCRLFADNQDLAHWRKLLGDFRMIHGHTHPNDGFRWEDGGRVLALNTSAHTSSMQAIGSLFRGMLEVFPVV